MNKYIITATEKKEYTYTIEEESMEKAMEIVRADKEARTRCSDGPKDSLVYGIIDLGDSTEEFYDEECSVTKSEVAIAYTVLNLEEWGRVGINEDPIRSDECTVSVSMSDGSKKTYENGILQGTQQEGEK